MGERRDRGRLCLHLNGNSNNQRYRLTGGANVSVESDRRHCIERPAIVYALVTLSGIRRAVVKLRAVLRIRLDTPKQWKPSAVEEEGYAVPSILMRCAIAPDHVDHLSAAQRAPPIRWVAFERQGVEGELCLIQRTGARYCYAKKSQRAP